MACFAVNKLWNSSENNKNISKKTIKKCGFKPYSLKNITKLAKKNYVNSDNFEKVRYRDVSI